MAALEKRKNEAIVASHGFSNAVVDYLNARQVYTFFNLLTRHMILECHMLITTKKE